jgi:hypothetical protein
MLQTQTQAPALVCEGPDTPVTMLPNGWASAPPGRGQLSCCRMHHRIIDAHGRTQTIPCDKERIGPVMSSMIDSRLRYHHERDELDDLRMWQAWKSRLMKGLPESTLTIRKSANRSDPLARFLREYRFSSATGSGKEVSPLLCAACSGSAQVTRALLEAGADPNLGYQGRRVIPYVGLQPGVTPLLYAVGASGDEETIRELLEHGADPDQRMGVVGGTALQYTAAH